MQFISESHKMGFFEHVQSSTEGNVLNENQDMIIPEKWQEKIIQTELLPGECTFHDGSNYKLKINKMTSLEIKNISTTYLYFFLGMLIHGSKPTLVKRRMGIAVNYCQTSIKMDPMKYTKSIAFTEDFRQPVLVSGRDYYGTLRYVKTLEEMQDQARPKRKKQLLCDGPPGLSQIGFLQPEIYVRNGLNTQVESITQIHFQNPKPYF